MTNKYALELIGLSKSFGGLEVIRGVDINVKEGCTTALIGPNGAGKTTIFNLISGVYALTKGTIKVNGQDITHLKSRDRIRYGLSRSFQNIRLMSHLSVLENLLLGQHSSIRSVRDMFVPYGLMPNNIWKQQILETLHVYGLDAYAYRRIDELAYGIRKQIDLVRSTLSKPSLLMLDEPAAGLNASESIALSRHLHTLRESGVTLVVIEHDMHFIKELCEHVVVLNFGEKIAEGTLKDVSSAKVVREAYLGNESGV